MESNLKTSCIVVNGSRGGHSELTFGVLEFVLENLMEEGTVSQRPLVWFSDRDLVAQASLTHLLSLFGL